jgi:hypothetical protein
MDEKNVDSALPQEKPKNTSTILLTSLSVVLYAINCLLSFVATDISKIEGQAELYGTISGLLIINLFVPLFLIGLFQLHKAFRNFRSIVKIFLWASMLLLLLNFGKIL